MRRLVPVMLAAAMMLLSAAPLMGQGRISASQARLGGAGERPLLEYFVSRHQLSLGGEEDGPDAVGGRLLWPLSPLIGPGSGGWWSGWVDRAALGGYLMHAPQGEERGERWRYGAQADLRLFGESLVGRVDPIVSLGVGALRERRTQWQGRASVPFMGPHLSVRTETYLSVTPGVGLRVQLVPGIGLRADARQVVDIGDGARRNVELSGGVSVGG